MTKNIKLLLSCGAVAALGVLAIQGCSSSGDDSSTPSGGSAGTSAGGGSAGKAGGSSAGTSSGGSGTAGSSTGGAPAGGAAGASTTGEAGESAGGAPAEMTQAELCTSFCTEEPVACSGDLSQYTSVSDCETSCAGFALGEPSDTGGQDTLYCRIYHLSVAASSAANAMIHCAHTKAMPAPGTPCTNP
jgi:hypothetical protein